MSKVRYYTDENVSRAIVRGLRQRGVNVISVSEANNLSLTDEEHLAFARGERRVVVTQDNDFLRLASSGKAHAGIVYAPQQRPIGEIIQGLVLIYLVLEAEEMMGNVEYL